MLSIDLFAFDNDAPKRIRDLKHNNHSIGSNWPVVYILNNKSEAYVGETIHAATRAEQHLMNKEKQRLTEIRIISDNKFNKSAILDLESFLIKHMHADRQFKLLNGNDGLQDHDYYDREEYNRTFELVWAKLKKLGIVKSPLIEIENSEIYKYSPYKSLGDEQQNAEIQIIKTLAENLEKDERSTIIVRGGAGTGKTILAVYLMKFFADLINSGPLEGDDPDLLEEGNPIENYAYENLQGIKKIGIVFPQSSLLSSIKDVFASVRGLKKSMVLSPVQVVNEFINSGQPYDLLFVDESHRLKCRHKGHLPNYGYFDKANEQLDLDPKYGTELDWMLTCSKNVVLFRDELQTVRPCDIDAEDFLSIIDKYQTNVREISLSTQWRCQGGNDYINYLKKIMSCLQAERVSIENYDVALYKSCNEMVEAIKQKESEYGLCRVVAGYAWPWDKNDIDAKTIHIQDQSYRWNRTTKNWINTPTVMDEIGCIHTIQGYDLNYAGVIIGSDIKYDSIKNKIYAVKDNYYDQQGKSGVAFKPDLLCEYLKNIYLTLLTRGIKGTYIYVCDDDLRKYMEQFFEVR